MTRVLISIVAALVVAGQSAGRSQTAPPIHVTLWFDTEDYILTEDDDATLRLAGMLTRLDVRATFKIVGEKARVLDARGRRDVIQALSRHDIGYHSDTHSQQPTVAVYLQHAGWEDGRAEFRRREGQGVRDIQRIFGVTPVTYGQPGSAWAPQSYPALRDLGIGMYMDEGDHVGIDDQPFYYGGMLNVFRMRSNLARMDLGGGESLARGKAAFDGIAGRLQAAGGGTISIYYHPNEWVQTEFWDAVNFRGGANPVRAEWKRPGTRPAAETEQAFRDFEAYVLYIKSRPGVRFVTATELMGIYADAARAHRFSPDDLLRVARFVQQEVTFQRMDGYALSAADAFDLIAGAIAAYVERDALPASASVRPLDGPVRPFVPPAGGVRPATVPWTAFARTARDVADSVTTAHRVPDDVWVGSWSISPADYLATAARVLEDIANAGRPPSSVALREGRFTADRHVTADSIDLWRWPIFPEGFHAPRLMELARLQAWTLKPAVAQR